MRLLSEQEVDVVAGAGDVSEITLPGGWGADITALPNTTIDITFRGPQGQAYTWNSGIAMSCWVVGVGVGGMALAFTRGNAVAANVIGFLAARACNAYVSAEYNDGQDGD